MVSIEKRITSVLCIILLLIPMGVTYALSEAAEPITLETPVYYNPEGGSFYHLNPNCNRINAAYRDKLVSLPYRELFSTLGAYLPCEICVSLDSQTLWVGEKELREAWPVLEAYTQENGVNFASPYAWKITPDMDTITVSVHDDRDYTFEYTLVRNDAKWAIEE